MFLPLQVKLNIFTKVKDFEQAINNRSNLPTAMVDAPPL